MEYKISASALMDVLAGWSGFLSTKVRLIACGGTALTLLGVKDTTKDIDFLVPVEKEYVHLTGTLKKLGYQQVTGSGWARDSKFVFDLFLGKRIHTTDLLESPLEEAHHYLYKELDKIYLGILNYNDLIVSKLFRGSGVDFDDCVLLFKNKKDEIDLRKLEEHYKETASYDVSETRVNTHLNSFIARLKREGIISGKI